MTDMSTKLDINEYIPCQLAALTHSIMRSVTGVLEYRFRISVPEWKVLAIIADKPGLPAVTIAQHGNMDTVAVSRAVSKLMDRSLIVRTLDNEDRRRSILNLSPEGRELHDQIAPLAAELEASLFEEFSADEKQMFEKALDILRSKSENFADAHQSGAQSVPATRDRSRNRFRAHVAAPLIGINFGRRPSNA